METKCEAKIKRIVNEKGKATIEFYKNGIPQYYCCGYIDSSTDEYIKECKNCNKFALNAKD